MTQRSISVVICAYTQNRWNELVAAIKSVQLQTLPPKEIIVVIDHNPNLLELVQEHVSDVIVVENTETPGLSGARNNSSMPTTDPHVMPQMPDRKQDESTFVEVER